MHLTKKLEKEILDSYHEYWRAYLAGNTRTMSSFMDESCQVIGSGDGEEFQRKKDAVKYYKATAAQVAGKTELKNRKIKASMAGNNILVSEASDFYVLMDGAWVFYGRARISTLFGKRAGNWKILQQHGSLPDARTSGGEQLNTDKIRKENLRLRDAVKRRTLELEVKNRKLEIETSLEKVRSIAMGMKEPDDMLDVCKIISRELQSLGIKAIRNVQTAIFYEERAVYMNYEYYTRHRKSIVTETSYTNHKVHQAFARKMLKGKGQVYSTHIKKVKDWIAYQKTTNVFIDRFLEKATSLNYYWHSLGPVALGISTYAPLKKEELNLFNRFLHVFELAYTRYIDIEQAIAQAREAQIELGLERVRARAMAMQKSDELKELISTVFLELTKLDLVLTRSLIMIYDPKSNDSTWWMANSEAPTEPIGLFVRYHEHPPYLAYIHAWKKRKREWQYALEGTIKKDWDDFLFTETELARLPDFVINGMKAPGRVYLTGSFNNFGCLNLASLEPLSTEHFDILLRFAKVFDLTYTRFNDLQKAEAQVREAQIEASLERVRSKTMAMHNSQDVADTVATMFDELLKLGIETYRCGIGIMDETKPMELWTAKPGAQGKAELVIGRLDMTIHPLFRGALDGWKKKKDSFSYDLKGDDLVDYYTLLNNQPDYPVRYDLSSLPPQLFHHDFYFPEGTLFVFSIGKLPAEVSDILKRFAALFGQTYRRYLDLQKAEVQAREAQIEAGLERVRSRALAMHHSEELNEVAMELRHQMGLLGQKDLEVCAIHLYDLDEDYFESWGAVRLAAGKGDIVQGMARFPKSGAMIVEEMMQNYLAGKKDYVLINNGARAVEWFGVVEKYAPEVHARIAGDIKKIPVEQLIAYWSLSDFSGGALLMVTHNFPDENSRHLLRRSANVFDLAYRRFKDLRRAEAQAKEARIEASLEKVRASAMAMHNSNDISVTTNVVFAELHKLNIQSKRCGVALLSKDSSTGHIYAAASTSNGEFHTLRRSIDMRMHTSLEKQYEYWLAQENYVSILSGEELKSYYQLPFFRSSTTYVSADKPGETEYGYYIPFSEGLFYAWTEKEYDVNEINILNRFKSIIDLTFRRYFDLQKAETQAREATIESALEKVRGRAMAMHNSNDLTATASLVFTELRKLGINPLRCGVGLLNRENRKAQLYSATAAPEGDSLSLVGWVLLDGHPVLSAIYDTWYRGDDYFPSLKREMLKSYYEKLKIGFVVPDGHGDYEQHGYFLSFSEGSFYGWAEKPFEEEEIRILKRFASVIDLTFRRYMELQKSEASAKEAVRQASLDRIRADIASMRTTRDLERITPLIWKELTTLGIPFIRCGVFIMDDREKVMHTFLSTPDGQAIAALKILYATPGNSAQVLSHWRKKEKYIDHWNEAAFREFAGNLVSQGSLASPEDYLASLPAGGFHLHFLPFLQGMLYVGNSGELGETELNVLQSVADAFSTAYARYEDFNKLEAAKLQVENTLTELKQAQQQLVQSEKMASLGELTAGIAHEIQNPLNFVNNFSEVSNELIDEMNEELNKGEINEAKAIAGDIKQNLEKINHHGKRAGDIVKGMLQHSRSGTGVKEPTDINGLADEYLRLAYHGLRAKDKTFNARMNTDFDPSVGNIPVVPQDIGRVILNLITNAFYAVTEKKKNQREEYDPVVTVTTKKIMEKVEIHVRDNGNGIPKKFLDKIFQPFFTTKPTGQGTGLGLSLSYDIIKVHGGELKVETQEGTGTDFTIVLPAFPFISATGS